MAVVAIGNAHNVARSGKRIDFLDAIRGIASVMVAVQHPLEVWVPGYLEWSLTYVNLGRIGIVAFFVVSGYVVGLTLSSQTSKTFIIRRFWRLYPAYWLTTLIYVGVSLLTGRLALDEFSLFVVLLNVTMLQGFLGVTSVLGVAWTLGSEIAFYTQSLVAKAGRALTHSVWFGFFWLALFGVEVATNRLTGSRFLSVAPLMMFTASLGFALFLWDSGKSKAVFTYLAAAALVVPALGQDFVYSPQYGDGSWRALGFNASYILGLALFATMYLTRHLPSPRILIWLGAISYGLYLIHGSVLAALEPLELPSPVLILAAITGSIVAGWATHVWIEKPATRLGRRLTSPASLSGIGFRPAPGGGPGTDRPTKSASLARLPDRRP